MPALAYEKYYRIIGVQLITHHVLLVKNTGFVSLNIESFGFTDAHLFDLGVGAWMVPSSLMSPVMSD